MTLDEVKDYLRIDTDDEDNYIQELIEASQLYIDGCVGESYKNYEKGIKQSILLQKKLINDMYENRGTTVPSNSKRDIIVSSILDKLSLYEGDADE